VLIPRHVYTTYDRVTLRLLIGNVLKEAVH